MAAVLAILSGIAQAFATFAAMIRERQLAKAGSDAQAIKGLEDANKTLSNFAQDNAEIGAMSDGAIHKRLRDDYTRD